MEDQIEHEVTITPTDEGYQLTCSCEQWDHYVTKSPPNKTSPKRKEDGFAQAVADRHMIANGWWPYTEHGKPEYVDRDTKEIKILKDWPYHS